MAGTATSAAAARQDSVCAYGSTSASNQEPVLGPIKVTIRDDILTWLLFQGCASCAIVAIAAVVVVFAPMVAIAGVLSVLLLLLSCDTPS